MCQFKKKKSHNPERAEYARQARSRGRGRGGSSPPPPEIFRFELNSALKVEFCLLK